MSLNLLYDFIDIGIKKKPSIDFLKRIKLPFVPDQIFANKEEVLLYRRNKYINEKYSSSRVRITTDSHFLEELPFEPRFASLATWGRGLLFAFNDNGQPTLSWHSASLEMSQPPFSLDPLEALITRNGPVFFDNKKGELWRYCLDLQNPLRREASSWELLASDILRFLPGQGGALLQEKAKDGSLPTGAYLNEEGRIYRFPFLLPHAPLLAAATEESFYLLEADRLTIFSAATGTEAFAEALPAVPKMMHSQGDFLALLYHDFFEIRKKGKLYLRKEKTRGAFAFLLSGNHCFLFLKEGKKPLLRVYSF